jgi:hypothetical protein
MLRLLVVFAAALCWGCFVFDELDQGRELMEQLGPGQAKQTPEADAPNPRAARAEPGALERVQAWWDDFRTPDPVGPDPNDRIVRCAVGGSAQFMRESDCELRGGRAGSG